MLPEQTQTPAWSLPWDVSRDCQVLNGTRRCAPIGFLGSTPAQACLAGGAPADLDRAKCPLPTSCWCWSEERPVIQRVTDLKCGEDEEGWLREASKMDLYYFLLFPNLISLMYCRTWTIGKGIKRSKSATISQTRDDNAADTLL